MTQFSNETRTCQNCKQEFVIEPEDFEFYKKIDVPPPTWCPECRFIRRMIWRTEINLYRRPDSRTGKIIFADCPETAPIKVWEEKDWISDIWDATEYGKNYDFSRPFFEQFHELVLAVPWPSRGIINLVNSDYVNNATNIKNSYLLFASGDVENSCYSVNISNSKEVISSDYIFGSELIYEGIFNRKCYKAFFCSYCEDSQNIYFCNNCVNISNCFGCVNLHNKSYHIFNEPVSKEEYDKFLAGAGIGSFVTTEKLIEKAREFKLKFPVKFIHGRHNVNVTGDYAYNSKNVKDSFHIENGENLRYCFSLLWGTAKDCYDYSRYSYNSELIYETMSSGQDISRLKFCRSCYPSSSNLSYCLNCKSCSDSFGCVGLRNKSYCILNKQYPKEEYEKLIPKIIEHMNQMPYTDKQGRIYKYGEFFPPEFSPYGYNESVCQEFFPLTKGQALAKGYNWKDPEEKNYSITIKPQSIPDNIKDVEKDILKETIGCLHEGICTENCTTAFRIIPQELEFYQKYNLPLPRLCPNCRHYQRLEQRNPITLWKRQCQCGGAKSENGIYTNQAVHSHKQNCCPNEFQTSYAPERPEIVYCEECYQNEVV